MSVKSYPGGCGHNSTVAIQVVYYVFMTGQYDHDDVKRKKFFRVTAALWVEASGHRGLWRGALMFFLFAFFLHLNKRLSKQSKHRWFDTPSRSLRRRRKDMQIKIVCLLISIRLAYEKFLYSVIDGFPSQSTNSTQKVAMSWRHNRVKAGSI